MPYTNVDIFREKETKDFSKKVNKYLYRLVHITFRPYRKLNAASTSIKVTYVYVIQ
jgi:hypothetical protein